MAVTFTYDETDNIKKIIAAWTGDGVGDAAGTSEKITGFLLKGITDPTDGPADNYNIIITDEEGVNVLGNCEDDLLARDTADTEVVYFLVDDDDGLAVDPPVVCDKLTVTIDTSGVSKSGQLIIYYREA